MARIRALEEADLDDAGLDAVRRIEGDRDTGVPWLFQFLLPSPELAFRISHVGEFLRAETTISDRDREFIILALSRKSDFQLEWSYHEELARSAGVEERDIEALVAGRYDELAPADAAMVDLAFSVADRSATDPLIQQMISDRGTTGAVEIVVLVAFIQFMQTVVDAFDIGLPEGISARLPVPAPGEPEEDHGGR
jgi:4-carboxymuconolactone decarboxylase